MTKPTPKKASARAGSRPPFGNQVGKTLRRRRLELKLNLNQVTLETRIQKVYLKAIEADNYQQLPHTVHAVGFIRRYAKLLGLDGSMAVTKYLEQRGPVPPAASRFKRLRVATPIIGTRLLSWIAVSLVMVAVVGYLIWQVSILAAPPRLTLGQPQDNQVVSASQVPVSGLTTPGAEVMVNGQLIYVDDVGHFSTTVALVEGVNIVSVKATNTRHKSSSIERSVLYKP